MSRAFNIGLICKSCPSSKTPSSVRPREKRTQVLALDSRLRGNERSLLLTPFVPAEAGTQALALDSRLRGNERSLLLTPFVPAKAGTQSRGAWPLDSRFRGNERNFTAR